MNNSYHAYGRSTSVKHAINNANKIKYLWSDINKHIANVYNIMSKVIDKKYLKDQKRHPIIWFKNSNETSKKAFKILGHVYKHRGMK